MKITILVLVGLIIGNFIAQAQSPSASMQAQGATAFCVSGNAEFKITFVGQQPFGYTYKVYPIDKPDSASWITEDKHNSSNTVVVKPNSINRTTVFELYEVFDGTMELSQWKYNQGSKNVTGKVTFQVDQIPKPNAGVDVASQCGLSIQLSGVPQNSAHTVYWSDAAEGAFSNKNIANPTFNADTDKLYSFTFNEVAGACLATDQVNVTFLGSPEGVLSGNSIFCKSGTLPVTANLTGKSPWRYEITDGSETITKENVSSTPHAFDLPVIGKKSFKFKSITDKNGCPASASKLTGEATTNDQEVVVSAGADQLVCSLSANLSAVAELTDVQWSSLSGNVTIAQPNSKITLVTSTVYQKALFVCKVVNNGCENSDTVEVIFEANPTLQLAELTDSICVGEDSKIDLILTGNADYKVDYKVGDNSEQLSFSESNPTINLPDVMESAFYTFTRVEDKNCFSTIDQTFVLYAEQPVTVNAGIDQFLDRKNSATIEATPNDLAGKWTVVAGQGEIADESKATTEVDNMTVGINVFSYTVNPNFCAPSSDEVSLEVLSYNTYNGFSPNGDGVNDYFIIDGAGSDVPTELTVFDQSGKVVYQQKNYNNDWTGVDKAGKDLEAGSYYFVFTSNTSDPIKDYLVIKR